MPRKKKTAEEYEHERTYYYQHISDLKHGTYKPLWKQGEIVNNGER